MGGPEGDGQAGAGSASDDGWPQLPACRWLLAASLRFERLSTSRSRILVAAAPRIAPQRLSLHLRRARTEGRAILREGTHDFARNIRARRVPEERARDKPPGHRLREGIGVLAWIHDCRLRAFNSHAAGNPQLCCHYRRLSRLRLWGPEAPTESTSPPSFSLRATAHRPPPTGRNTNIVFLPPRSEPKKQRRPSLSATPQARARVSAC